MNAESASCMPVANITRWRNLLDTVGEPIATSWAEFFAEMSLPVKFAGDRLHGGWSAAIIEPCERADENVVGMSALVLDYDSGTTIADAADLWADRYGLIHTTRKHTDAAPRFRVILPLSRIVSPDEYAVIWRWAQRMTSGANQRIDPSTKNVSRFWYLPGTSDGSAPVVVPLAGDVLDPDPLIIADRYEQNERNKPAQAPTDNVERRAVRYLQRMPEAIAGSRGHDALWRAALAMVRGFRLSAPRAFAILKEHYNPRCQPPWSDRELHHKVSQAEADARTPYGYLADVVREAPSHAEDDWSPPPYLGDSSSYDEPDLQPPPAPSAPSVAAADAPAYAVDNHGRIRNTFGNIAEALRRHEDFAGAFAYDDMRVTPTIRGAPVTDAEIGRLRIWFEHHLGFTPSEANVRAAVTVVADARHVHAVRDYLRGLKWDGMPRIGRVLVDVLGAKDSALGQATIRKWFISAVARALLPGCKVDTALVLVGKQGARKSTFFSALGDPWFVDTGMDIENNDGRLQLHSAWIYEWAEIENVTGRKHASSVKAFISSCADTFREPYGRSVGSHPRSTVIVGTTNDEQILTDPTGSRRFWIIRVGEQIDTAWVRANRDQLWAEAVVAATTPFVGLPVSPLGGEPWWLTDGEEAVRERKAEKFQIDDPWMPLVDAWLRGLRPGDAVTSAKALQLGLDLPAGQMTQGALNRVGAVLRRLGYDARRQRDSRGRALRVWVRGGDPPVTP